MKKAPKRQFLKKDKGKLYFLRQSLLGLFITYRRQLA